MRWFQYRLRTLMIAITLVSVGLALIAWAAAPYRGQAATIALIEKMGGTTEIAEAPSWLRWVGEPHHVIQVDLSQCDDPDTYIAAVGRLPNVESVIVGGMSFRDEHAAQLRALRSLKALILDSTSVTDAMVASLRTAFPGATVYQSERRAIRRLSKVGKCEINSVNPFTGTRHSHKIAEGEWHAEVQSFEGYACADADLVYVRPLKRLQHFSCLSFGGRNNPITDAGVAHFADATCLKTMSLRDTQVGDAGLVHLRGLTSLTFLSLHRTRVTDAGLPHLSQLEQLEELGLGYTQVTDAGLASLRGLKRLKLLDLIGTRVRDDRLGELTHLPELQVLCLRRTQVTDTGVGVLSTLKSLKELWINDTSITNATIPRLKELSRLEVLYLGGTRITDGGVEELRRALPRCDIRR